MMEWLVSWVANNAVGFLVKSILNEDFAKDLAKDYAKDFFKSSLQNTTKIFKEEPIQKAVAEAVNEFLQLVENELKSCQLADDDINKFNQPLKRFICHKPVKEILGKAFDGDCKRLDYQSLETIWQSLNLPELPVDFNWQAVTDSYVIKCQQILTESPELRDILNSRNLQAIQINSQEAAGIIPNFDLQQYQEAIRERYINLKLDSLDTSGYAYNELRLWSIFVTPNVREVHQVLPQVHELPKEHLRRMRDSNQIVAEAISWEELEQYERVYFEQPLASVLDIVNQPQTYKYIVILGDPGSGKSTLLQYLALAWVEKTLDQIGKRGVFLPPIPLLIELRAYMRNYDDGHCKNFLEFFHQSPGAISHLNQHQLQAQLKTGNALVMFDGLDEVFDSGKREDMITAIHRFTNEYPQVQVIVTSRVIGYKPQRLRDAQFRHFMLQDLDSQQIQDFINRWHNLTFKYQVDQQRKKERLLRAINTSKAITELAGNPLLLTMMAIINRNQELPRDRAELYKKASELLLYKWDVERALSHEQHLPTTIDYQDKQAMLRQVAYYMQTSKKGLAGNWISASNLEKIFTDYLKNLEISEPRDKARRLINQLRTRNFMLCFLGADYYGFVHRTFLEYFCAWEFVWQFKETQTLSLTELKQEVFGKHWQDETWHEVLRLIAGMIEPRFVAALIEYLMLQNGEQQKFTNLFLAAKCLAEVRKRSVIGLTANKLLVQLQDLTKYDLWYYYDQLFDDKETKLVEEIRTQAVTAIATTWKDDFKIKSWLKQCATLDENWHVRCAAVQELARNFVDDSDTISFLKQRTIIDESWNVRRAGVQELARNFPDDSSTIQFLKDRAIADGDADVRRVALEELARNFPEDSSIVQFLKDCASADDADIRRVALEELACNFPDDTDTISILQDRAITDDDADMRRVAVEQLARHFPDDADTMAILQDHATVDEDADVRRVAVEQLAHNFPYDGDTLSILKERANVDEDADVRRVAVEALACHFQNHADTIGFLKYRIIADNDSDVRQTAIQGLARNFADDTVISFLKTLATADENWQVRRVAVVELACNFPAKRDIIIFLQSRATIDDDADVRQALLQALARNFPNDADIIDVIKTRGTVDEDADVRRVAVEELARNFPDDIETISFLQYRATSDSSWNVRLVAVAELARFLDDIEIIAFFKTRAIADANYYVRRAAVQALARNCHDHADIISFLKCRATIDAHWQVRRAATEELARNFQDNADSINFLKYFATADESWRVRQTAVQELARNFKDEAEMFEIFYKCAVNDPFQRQNSWQTNPRRVALDILIKQYPDHSQTLPLLHDRVSNDVDIKVKEFAQKKLGELIRSYGEEK
ncbi:NACHT domain-containing protein [Tolypothrix sp. PCC 7910]|uniref:HEAT repeat domain-containing protein n=1 Tax=Tolypothrix sp. PCC 7910 TaxID=2099387 RepID=UPI00142783A1|nr:HEAT repeat domain-containing protein [Tolypothrix sp. PCC 7910]QIR38301.1 NACHT domain-containing protein [Tolypothrix sp. PCC 7910]